MALAMAVQAINRSQKGQDQDAGSNDNDVSSAIFQEAKSRGFTKCGEMFSADNMASLTRKFVNSDPQALSTAEMSETDLKKLVCNCLDSNYLLVP